MTGEGDGLRCPGCGAKLPPAGLCRFCGATAAVDGRVGKLVDSDLSCPRCAKKPPMRGVVLQGIRVDACFACHGMWFETGALEHAVQAESTKPPEPARRRGGGSPVSGATSAPEDVKYLECPRCKGGMARQPLARKPLVIADRCGAHGTWLDGGEFDQLLAVARARGPAEALGADSARPRALKADPDLQRILDAARRDPDMFTPQSRAESAAAADRRGGFFGLGRRRRYSILDLVSDLAGFFR